MGLLGNYMLAMTLTLTFAQPGMVPCSTEESTQVAGTPQLPTLPDQFTVTYEATITQKHYSIYMKEYYDYTNNRGLIEHYDPRTQETIRIVMDFNNKVSHKYFKNGTCIVQSTTVSNTFGFMSNGNGSHIKGVKDLLIFGDQMGERYIGESLVRGIPVNQWSTCVKLPHSNGTFTLDYYFTKGQGHFINGINETVPLRAVINGTVNGTAEGYFHNIYEFIDFHPGPIQDTSVFEIPVGTFCKNSTVEKPLPKIPHHFTLSMETVLQDGSTVFQQMFYDNVTKLIRIDGAQPWMHQSRNRFANRPLNVIIDFNTNLQYIIDKWENNCTVTTATIPNSPMLSPMLPPDVFLGILSGNYTYQGQKTLRGVAVESWAMLNQSDFVTELFFNQVSKPKNGPRPFSPDNHGNQGERVSRQYQLFGMNSRPVDQTTGRKGSVYMNIYNFMSGHPDLNVFDVSTCYDRDHHYTYMSVKLEGNYQRHVLNVKKDFTAALRSTLARGAKISGTRVTDILIEPEPQNQEQLRVSFKILDNQLTDVHPSLTGPSLATAKQNLQQAVDSGLNFDVQYPTIEKNFQILSLWEISSAQTQSSPHGHSSGAMAGLGIGMLVVGAILGLLAAFVIYKRIDTSVPYKITT